MSPLTIVIPTFNRNEKLVDTLRSLQQLKLVSGVQIFVIDNASDVPVETTIRNSGLVFEKLLVHRNAYNIGGNANILRSFEIVETDWVWILGDTDRPEKDALERIFIAITQNPDALRIAFSGTGKKACPKGSINF